MISKKDADKIKELAPGLINVERVKDATGIYDVIYHEAFNNFINSITEPEQEDKLIFKAKDGDIEFVPVDDTRLEGLITSKPKKIELIDEFYPQNPWFAARNRDKINELVNAINKINGVDNE